MLALQRENSLIKAFSNVATGDGEVDLVKTNVVHSIAVSPANPGAISFVVDPAARPDLKDAVEQLVAGLTWVTSVNSPDAVAKAAPAGIGSAGAASAAPHGSTQAISDGLKNVKYILAVTSCKGGVGKSTVAVNLACSFSKLGLDVGVLDADVYGPSIPSMISPPDSRLLKTPEGRIQPILCNDMKFMSYGWSVGRGKAAVLRGPVVSGVINQLANNTDWGTLDVLVVDMPPGTGDVNITIGQQANVSGAIVVTTPQKLSVVDVMKGIELNNTLNIPTLAVVENMLYFECDHGQRYHIFGPSVGDRVAAQYGIPLCFGLPIERQNSDAIDDGVPLVMSDQASEATVSTFMALAGATWEELNSKPSPEEDLPTLSFNPYVGVSIRQGERTAIIDTVTLRLACMAQQAVDPATLAGVSVVSAVPKGNYAVQMKWSDGHSSIFGYNMLWDMAGDD